MSDKAIYYSAATSGFTYHIKDSIKESYYISDNIPFTINVKRVNYNEIGTPHYGDSLEINICENVTGTLFVANTAIKVDGNTAIIVPPNTIHFSRFNSGHGTVYVLHVFFDKLDEYINLKNLFNWPDYNFSTAPLNLDIYSEIIPYIYDIINCDGYLPVSIRSLISIFEIINARLPKNATSTALAYSAKLNSLIDWTAHHFCEKITIDDAAKIMHYNKYYFCRYFKQIMGISYVEYVNQLRIIHAIKLLRDGKSATEACFECGFDSLSYFVNLFKRVTGYTTKSYIKNHLKSDEGTV